MTVETYASRCAQCNADWSFAETQGSQDDTLDNLLQDLIKESVDLGRCYSDPSQLITGSDVSSTIAWHGDREGDVNNLKVAIHNYIQANYEKDD